MLAPSMHDSCNRKDCADSYNMAHILVITLVHVLCYLVDNICGVGV